MTKKSQIKLTNQQKKNKNKNKLTNKKPLEIRYSSKKMWKNKSKIILVYQT